MRKNRHRLSLSATVRVPRSTLPWALLIGCLVFGGQLWFWQIHVRTAYFLSGDDFALLVHSARFFHAHPAEWFTRGFADYFHPYPDLALRYSEFLRPMDNAVYALSSVVFGRVWSAYLLANYLIAAALVAMAFALARQVLRLPGWLSALVVCATLTSPAYTYHVLYRPSFAFDYLGALWALCCAFCLLQGRLGTAWIFCLLAVLSKETAYYVAPAAFLSLLTNGQAPLSPRRGFKATLFLVPLLLVYGLRWADFRGATGVYVLAGFSAKVLLRNVVLGLTQWPYMLPGEQHIFERSLHNLASLLLSVLLWGLLGSLLVWLGRHRPAHGNMAEVQTWDSRRTLLIFLLGSLCLPVTLGLGQRFGASAFPLLFLLLGALGTTPGLTVPVRWAACGALIVMAIEGLTALPTLFGAQTLAAQQTQWALSRSLVDQLTAERHAVVFLLPDASEGFASPETLERFTSTRAEVVPIVSLAGGSCSTPEPAAFAASPGRLVWSSALRPGCGTYSLFATGRQPGDPGKRLRRDLPTAEVLYRSPQGATAPATFEWQTLTIELVPKVASYVVLAPDGGSNRYRVLAAAGPTSGNQVP